MADEKAFNEGLRKFQATVEQPHRRIADINRQIAELLQEMAVIKAVALTELKLPDTTSLAIRAACW